MKSFRNLAREDFLRREELDPPRLLDDAIEGMLVGESIETGGPEGAGVLSGSLIVLRGEEER